MLHEETPSKFELRGAYRVAGSSFAGQLRKMFIILADDHVPDPHTPPSKAPKAGGDKSVKDNKPVKKNKRHAADEGTSASSKKMPATQ